jgi:hypothetical protein
MNTNTITPIEILQSIIDECCDQHDQCIDCKHILSCRKLWDRLSEQITTRPLSLENLKTFLDEFNQLWQNEDIDDLSLPLKANKLLLQPVKTAAIL